MFGIQATCDFIEKHAPLDVETFFGSETQLDIGLYNLDTNQIEYFDKSYFDPKEQTLVKAACALFLLTRPYQFQGHPYMDAGLIDMIPIEQSIRRGNKKHIFISTKEENYVRKPAPNWQLRAAGLFYPGNKEVKENLRKRHIRYEEQWERSSAGGRGKAPILRPHKDLGITRYTTDRKLLEPWFQLGYDETEERMDEIRVFIREE
ncbi:MAG: patatin family protein [Merdibacter sp.]